MSRYGNFIIRLKAPNGEFIKIKIEDSQAALNKVLELSPNLDNEIHVITAPYQPNAIDSAQDLIPGQPKNINGNPCFDYLKHLVFEKFGKFTVHTEDGIDK